MANWFLKGALVVLLGLGLIAVPIVAFEAPDQTEVVVHVDKMGGLAPSAAESSIANYRQLNTSVQETFDAGREGGTTRIDAVADSGTVSHFETTPYVKYSGGFYHVRLYERPDSYTVDGVGSILLTMLGGFAVLWGVFIALVGSHRPFNLPRSFAVPVATTIVLIGSSAGVTGGSGVPPGAVAMTFLPMPLFFIGGAFAKHGYLSPLFAMTILLVLSTFFVAFLLGHPLIIPFLFAGAVLAGGFPWLLLGWSLKK